MSPSWVTFIVTNHLEQVFLLVCPIVGVSKQPNLNQRLTGETNEGIYFTLKKKKKKLLFCQMNVKRLEGSYS